MFNNLQNKVGATGRLCWFISMNNCCNPLNAGEGIVVDATVVDDDDVVADSVVSIFVVRIASRMNGI